MRRRALWGLGLFLFLTVIVSSFVLQAGLNERIDPYARLVSKVGSHWNGMKVASIAPRDDPDSLAIDSATHTYASAMVTFDRRDLPARVKGPIGTFKRKAGYRMEKRPLVWWQAMINRLTGKPSAAAPELLRMEDEPMFPVDFYRTKQRIGKDSRANIVQDLVLLEKAIKVWHPDVATQEFLIVRAELELEAGEKEWVRKDLAQLRALVPQIHKSFQARAERLRTESGETGPTFLKP